MSKKEKEYRCTKCDTTDIAKFYPLKKNLCKRCKSIKGLNPNKSKKFKCKTCSETDPNNFYKSYSTCKSCANKKTKEKYNFYKSKYNYTGTEEEFRLRQERKGKYGKEYSKIWQKQNRFKHRVNTAKYRALKNNIPFDLTEEFVKGLWYKQEGKCYYSGIPMTIEEVGRHSVSLDRQDSSKGYTKDNVVLCSHAVNTMKSDLSIDEFKHIINNLYANFKK